MSKTKIGVFDSGIGGKSVANAIAQALPEIEIDYKNDKAHLPYGTKTPEELHQLVLPILKTMVADGCRIIVIACNSVTTTLIKHLQQELPVPLIGIEPMVEVAAEKTKSKVIAVCATPATLKSARYAWLKQAYAQDLKILEPDCSKWARMIEDNEINHEMVATQIDEVCQQGADVIVLGCTHYHWIEAEIINATAGLAKVIQPEKFIVERLRTMIAQLDETDHHDPHNS